jgi:hypothetical protein
MCLKSLAVFEKPLINLKKASISRISLKCHAFLKKASHSQKKSLAAIAALPQ